MVNIVIGAERDFGVATVDAAAAGIDQMLHRMVPAGFQNVVESDNVAFNICVRIFNAIAHACLCRKVHHNIKTVSLKKTLNKRAVGKIPFDEGPSGICVT